MTTINNQIPAGVSRILDAEAGLVNNALNDVQRDAFDHKIDEIKSKMQNNEGKIDIRKVVAGALVGALCGIMLAVLVFDRGSIRMVLWGIFAGGIFGFISTGLYEYLDSDSIRQYRKEVEARREALRRYEQLKNEEQHNEYVYYDAASSQGFLYKLLCMPHYGKITSERIIYSAHIPVNWSLTLEGLFSFIFYYWRKKVEQIDYDLVLDVGVEQGCHQYLTDTGSIILHVSAKNDVSVVSDEREKLTRAIEGKDERKLKESIRSASNIECLKTLVNEAEELLKVIVHQRYEKCQKENIEFTHIFAHDNIETNTAQVIHVNDVYRPYAVLDDLSYKITKAKNAAENGGISKVLRDQYLSTLTAGDLRVEEEKQIIKNLASGKKP